MLLALCWGGLWGIALGMWLVAPAVLETHHLRPQSTTQWFVVIAGLAVIFGVLGALMTAVAGLAVAVIEKIARRPFRDRTWAYALFAPVLLVAAYVLDSLLIHQTTFGTVPFWDHRGQISALAVTWLVAWILLIALYRWIRRRRERPQPIVLAMSLAVVAICGAMMLVLQSPPVLEPARAIGPLKPRVSSEGDTPLLFIGLDGATWRVLQPAIENGSAPTLRSLVQAGVHGITEALWPPYWSGAAWAAILTGFPREVTGVYEDLAGTGPGLPMFQVPLATSPRLNPIYTARAFLALGGLIAVTPPPRALLNGAPVWEILHDAGVQTAVVRFRFTYPPEGQASTAVSDWVGQDQWERIGVRRRATPDTVAPSHESAALLAPFLSSTPSDPDLFAELLPGPSPRQPPDTPTNPVAELRLASDIDNRTFEASEVILRQNPAQPFLAVYLGGLDSVEHAFWQYRFPDDFQVNRPAPQDTERLGPVVDRYVRYLDRRLHRLLSLYSKRPNVLILSDHGHGATTFATGWRGWHTKEGVFLLAGPSVPGGTEPIKVSYYDVVPTIVRLKGFEKPDALTGESVLR